MPISMYVKRASVCTQPPKQRDAAQRSVCQKVVRKLLIHSYLLLILSGAQSKYVREKKEKGRNLG
jgi:hypothetical protein